MYKAKKWMSTRLAWPIVALLLSAICMACAGLEPRDAIDPSEDSPRQRAMVHGVAHTLAGPMQARGAQEKLFLSMDELYSSLSKDQQRFLDAIRHMEGADTGRGVAKGVDEGVDWVWIEGQRVGEAGVDRQYSDPLAFKALDEYRWLAENASRFNFFNEGHASASPWHWYHDTTP